MTKVFKKCAVNGVLAPNGICGKVKCNDLSQCGAHGNTKCIHKRDPDWTKEKEIEAINKAGIFNR